jgi:hypothetical protein
VSSLSNHERELQSYFTAKSGVEQIENAITYQLPTNYPFFVAVENFLPLHCEPPQAAKQSPYRPGDCFASLAMTGGGFFYGFRATRCEFPERMIEYPYSLPFLT